MRKTLSHSHIPEGVLLKRSGASFVFLSQGQ